MFKIVKMTKKEYSDFDKIRHIDECDNEFWYARELDGVLEYKKWENFKKVIDRAIIACDNSGYKVEDHFPEVRKIVKAGATTKPINDYKLSRYACYLIVQNADPRKKLNKNEKILDFMGSTELAANLFRISQTTEKIKKDKKINKENAKNIHYEVGRKVRKAIKDIGGTMPENLPTPKKSIKQIEKEHMKKLKEKAKKGKLLLDE